ncbi:disks large homolog 5-like isoform X1 [Rattus norvegicus]|uniref:disks large homolog 5-like isoform X1 n=1 Tax=Rattus norvegicus TaxID=10116 RepID=UPI002FD82520
MFSRLRKNFGRVNADFGQTGVRESRLSSKINDGQRKLAWGMLNDGRLTASPGPVVINKEANTENTEEQRLIRQLQSATEERNELRDLLTYVTERYRNNRASRYIRSNPFYEKLKIKEREVMSLLHNLEMRNIEHCEKFQELQKEINFYRNLPSRIHMDKICMQKKLFPFRKESKAEQLDSAPLLQKFLFDLNKKDKDEQEKTSNLQTKQHLVGTSSCVSLKLSDSICQFDTCLLSLPP